MSRGTLQVAVGGVAVLGPGLAGWDAARPVLAGEAPWQEAPCTPPPPALLPATERRRTSPAVRLALAVAAEAVQRSGLPPEELDSVFASSNGDGQVVGAILDALHAEDGVISPTQFHNSVHNAAAGYWGIAVGSARPSVSVGGHDAVFGLGLLHAAAVAVAQREPVLVCAYDAPLLPPLDAVRRTELPFATALVLLPAPRPGALAMLTLRHVALPGAEPAAAEGLDGLALRNPVARALPLLRALAAGRAAAFTLGLLDESRLELSLAPC